MLRYQKRGTCFATLLQNELKSDIARFTTHVQTCLAANQFVPSCVNTDFWIKVTTYTQGVTSLAEKQVCLGPAKRAPCKDFVKYKK